MPSAPKELTDQWEADAEAIKWLEGLGWTLTRTYEWAVPDGFDLSALTAGDAAKTWSAVRYLILEWDYGGVVNGEG